MRQCTKLWNEEEEEEKKKKKGKERERKKKEQKKKKGWSARTWLSKYSMSSLCQALADGHSRVVKPVGVYSASRYYMRIRTVLSVNTKMLKK
jgi:hypothetical protein